MDSRTEISALGEFGLIAHLTKNIELQNASSIIGVGDDAAVIDHFGELEPHLRRLLPASPGAKSGLIRPNPAADRA